MAETDLDTVIRNLNEFKRKVEGQVVDIMRSEVPIGRTRELYRSIRVIESDAAHSLIGSTLEYAHYVENGRGPVSPKGKDKGGAQALMWIEYEGQGTSTHTKNKMYAPAGEKVYSMHAGPTEPNDFLGRTVDKITESDIDLSKGIAWETVGRTAR